MSDTTMIELKERRIQLNQTERGMLQDNIEKALKQAKGEITKAGQCINLAFRMQNGHMMVLLKPTNEDLLASEQNPSELDPKDEDLLTNALSNVYGDVENSTIPRGVISRATMQGRNLRRFLGHDYTLVKRGINPMTVEWIIENEVGKPYIKVLQVEVKKAGDDTLVNWNVVGKANTNWLRLPMEGGVKVK